MDWRRPPATGMVFRKILNNFLKLLCRFVSMSRVTWYPWFHYHDLPSQDRSRMNWFTAIRLEQVISWSGLLYTAIGPTGVISARALNISEPSAPELFIFLVPASPSYDHMTLLVMFKENVTMGLAPKRDERSLVSHTSDNKSKPYRCK